MVLVGLMLNGCNVVEEGGPNAQPLPPQVFAFEGAVDLREDDEGFFVLLPVPEDGSAPTLAYGIQHDGGLEDLAALLRTASSVALTVHRQPDLAVRTAVPYAMVLRIGAERLQWGVGPPDDLEASDGRFVPVVGLSRYTFEDSSDVFPVSARFDLGEEGEESRCHGGEGARACSTQCGAAGGGSVACGDGHDAECCCGLLRGTRCRCIPR